MQLQLVTNYFRDVESMLAGRPLPDDAVFDSCSQILRPGHAKKCDDAGGPRRSAPASDDFARAASTNRSYRVCLFAAVLKTSVDSREGQY
jgi:hypothetical protein